MKNSVLDSYAVLTLLSKERGCEKIVFLLEKAAESGKLLFIAAPNWVEIRYIIERKMGADKWFEVREKLSGLPIEIVPADQELAELAGEIKASHKMSLADCFVAALAKQKKAELYTGDPEFRDMESELKIVWL